MGARSNGAMATAPWRMQGVVAPSTTDAGSSGNVIFDYYCGTELYPRICGIDVKVFINCRFGMMGWAVIILDYAGAQLAGTDRALANSLFVSVALQLVYIAKFFWWESGCAAAAAARAPSDWGGQWG